MFRWSLGAGHALMLVLALGAMAPAAAVPLEAPVCEQLQLQYDALRADGAADDMARGPEWARANLSDERLRRVGILLEIEEKLNFRCGLAKITLPAAVEGGEEEVPGPGEATIEGSGGTIVLPQKAPPSPGRPATAAATTAPPKASAASPAAPKRPPAAAVKKAPAKKKTQPKVDDAYRPPSRTSGSGGAGLGPKQ
jgi:hypothetical protein